MSEKLGRRDYFPIECIYWKKIEVHYLEEGMGILFERSGTVLRSTAPNLRDPPQKQSKINCIIK